jgi:hypothetical protein
MHAERVWGLTETEWALLVIGLVIVLAFVATHLTVMADLCHHAVSAGVVGGAG